MRSSCTRADDTRDASASKSGRAAAEPDLGARAAVRIMAKHTEKAINFVVLDPGAPLDALGDCIARAPHARTGDGAGRLCMHFKSRMSMIHESAARKCAFGSMQMIRQILCTSMVHNT